MLKKLAFILGIIIFISCNSNSGNVFAEYKNIGSGWEKNEKIEFVFQAPDSVSTYNIFLNLRNDETYPFSNLFLIVNISLPNNETVSDTLEYRMAEPDGEWLGEGFSLKENKLWYKENVTFPTKGECKLTVEHAMRKNSSIEGIQVLKGITDVGIEIEKTDK